MPQRTATIASRVGLHARPAGIFIEAVRAQGVPVQIALGDGPAVDASSILMLMTLGASNGDTVTLTAEGEGADAALDALVVVLETDLDAE